VNHEEPMFKIDGYIYNLGIKEI